MRALLVGLVLAAVAAPPAYAFECSHSAEACFVNLRWPSRTIRYVVRVPPGDSRIDQDTLVRLTEDAFRTWQNVDCTDLRFELAGVLEEGEATDVKNEIRVVTQNWNAVAETERFPAGLTRVSHNTIDGTIARARIFLNEEMFSMVDAERGCTEELDLGAVLTHEVGHFIGFAHPCEDDDDFVVGDDVTKNCPTVSCDQLTNAQGTRDRSTLWPYVDSCDTSARSLNESDRAGVCFLYPTGHEGAHCTTLPEQPEPYVSNAAFGCSATQASSENSGTSICSLFVIGALVSMRRNQRKRTTRSPIVRG